MPRNPLDVLAQQIVAMVAVEDWSLDELPRVVRRAAPFSGLGEATLRAVLDMLAGPVPERGVRRAAAAARVGPRRATCSAAGPARCGSR